MEKMTETNQITNVAEASVILFQEDLGKLGYEQKKTHYLKCCEFLGVNPASKPFDIIRFNGKEQLYANSNFANQLSITNNLSCSIVSEGSSDDLYRVTVEVKGEDGRVSQDYGIVDIKGLMGDRLANAMMKCFTKAKRRAILAHCGYASVL